MVDALDVQHVERAPDVGRRAFLAGVRDAVQAELAARAKTRANFSGGWPRSLLSRPTPMNCSRYGSASSSVAMRGVFAQVAQKAQDQRASTPSSRRALRARGQAVDHGRERDAALGVRLRVEEDLGVDDVVGRGAAEVRHRHVVEVLLACSSTLAPA